jgi:2-haloalkanoic acid dehalogenase type II
VHDVLRDNQSMMKQAVLFDYYGTLAFLGEGRHSIWARLRHELNVEMSIDEIDRIWFETAMEFGPEGKSEFVTLCESWVHRGAELLGRLGLPRDGQTVSDLYDNAHAKASLFPGVQQCLAELQSTYRVGLLSNADASHLLPSLRSNALSFDVVAYSEQLRCYKPDRAAFLSMCESMGVKPEAAIYVGDSPMADIVGAHDAGMQAIWVNRLERDWPTSIRPPRAQLSDLGRLSSTVDGLFTHG